jgi:hypothetical protein
MGVTVFELLSAPGGANLAEDPQPIKVKAERYRQARYRAEQRFIFSSAAVFQNMEFKYKAAAGIG